MKLEHIHKEYHNKLTNELVFDDLSIDLNYQGFVLLYGYSGAGKTT